MLATVLSCEQRREHPQIMAAVDWDQVYFEQEKKPTLNSALEQGRCRALAHHADAILILPADLPLLMTTDIDQLYQ